MCDLSSNTLDELPVLACLISLASNYHAEYYLTQVMTQFEYSFNLEKVQFSEIFKSQDKKFSECSNIYHNQMMLLYFRTPIGFGKFTQITKQIEIFFDRKKFVKPIVTLDIDIIAFSTEKDELEKLKAIISPLNCEGHFLNWYRINRRFPLATYEIAGLENLCNQGEISTEFVNTLIN